MSSTQSLAASTCSAKADPHVPAIVTFFICVLPCTGIFAQEREELSLAEVRGNAVWTTSQLDLSVDVTGASPSYSGEISLKLTGKDSFGPMLLLNNREVSMTNLELEVLNASELPGYQTVEIEGNPSGRPSSITWVRFEEVLDQGQIVTLAFSYDFSEEQGQLFSRPSEGREDWIDLHYASWVTGWYPYPVSDDSTLVSIDGLSSQGTTRFVLPADMFAVSNGVLVEDTLQGEARQQTWRGYRPRPKLHDCSFHSIDCGRW